MQRDHDLGGQAIIDELRQRWAAFYRLPFEQQNAINEARIVPVHETMDMLDRAIREDWFGRWHGRAA